MLGFKGFGFLVALVYNFFFTLSALKEFVLRSAWPYIPGLAKRPEDKFHDVITRVMLQVGFFPHYFQAFLPPLLLPPWGSWIHPLNSWRLFWVVLDSL